MGARLYNEYIDQAIFAEEAGFDAITLNEHHGTPYCMGAVMNVEAAILARVTKKVRIVLVGNPLPVIKHPIRMAEELAEIDLISHGRLVPDGCAAPAASSSSTTPTPPTTASISMKRTTS